MTPLPVVIIAMSGIAPAAVAVGQTDPELT
jgi:hypothetical protein